MTLFILGQDESSQLFPSYLEKQEKLLAGKTYDFPRSAASFYEVSTDRESEINYLLLLFTKEEINFREKETAQNVLRFIAAISPSQKYLKSYTLLIKE
jgi:hypothetical protein